VLRGVYSSASGMMAAMERVSMHADNIANAQTAGYKRREMSSVPFKELIINIVDSSSDKVLKLPIGTGSGVSFMSIDNSQGALKNTGSALDFGISGNGLFTLQKRNTNGVEGQYTSRNGRFLLDPENYIVNPEGDYLLDENDNKIQIPKEEGKDTVGDLNSRLLLKENGILFDNGNELTKLKIQTDSNTVNYIPELKLIAPVQQIAQRTGNGVLTDINGKEIRIKQGFIEVSNVQVISEMIGMLYASKNYESGHKLITTEDKVLDKAINELGRTG
jgi:flagellar basal-body rod protein FlgG